MKIFCIGRNYVAHVIELNNEIPDEPVIFMKPESALLPPNASFHYPEFTNDLHYECELVFRVSKNGKNIATTDALLYCDAITVGIDFTARDIQNKLKDKGLPWEKAKAWDHSAIIGTWVSMNEIKNLKDINFCLYKNKEIVQQGNSGLMINDLENIIAHISTYFSLCEGDLIFTGTPAGVGVVSVGDDLEAFIEDDSLLSLNIQ